MVGATAMDMAKAVTVAITLRVRREVFRSVRNFSLRTHVDARLFRKHILNVYTVLRRCREMRGVHSWSSLGHGGASRKHRAAPAQTPLNGVEMSLQFERSTEVREHRQELFSHFQVDFERPRACGIRQRSAVAYAGRWCVGALPSWPYANVGHFLTLYALRSIMFLPR